MTQEKHQKIFKGTIVSNKMNKTIVVQVTSLVKHPKYKKYTKRSKKYKAHDEQGAHAIGDVVFIKECRPISKDKHFRVLGNEERLYFS